MGIFYCEQKRTRLFFEKIWKEKNYGLNREGVKARPTIEQIKQRLLEMAKQKHIENTTDKNGQRRIE